MKRQPPNQTSLFDIDPIEIPIVEEKKDFFDDIMAKLEQINVMTISQNDMLKSMIDELQEGWSEDEKLMVNDPKAYYAKQKLKDQEIIKETEMAKELTNEAVEVLQNCKVESNVVKLPDGQLDRKIYTEVKNKLELIGGKWKGNKVMGFVFNEDPTDLLDQIANGETRNLKKEFQFFATPDHLADRLVSLADIQAGQSIHEPSAGQGAIVKAIHRAGFYNVTAHEAMPVNQIFLKKIEGCELLGADFLEECSKSFDRIIANPPFSKNQDITHVQKMYSVLNHGGRLVSIMSKHWQHATNKKETAFRGWLDEVGAEVHEIDAGEFKESGTSIATVIVVIDKAA
ncbi:MAG: class I SAM-dependent methyltransferase [Chryseobacterium sp.]|nr:MAG: class I SAM-dependent methyltransferase [Chryseobacterium sp.]